MSKAGTIAILIFFVGVVLAFAQYWTDYAAREGFSNFETIVTPSPWNNQ